MKFIVALILTVLLALIGGIWLEWWSIALAGLIVALLVPQAPGKAFLSGFLAVFFLWGLLAWWIDMKNDSILSKKIAQLFSLGDNSLLLVLITALIGGLVAGFGALTGSFLRNRR